MPAPVPHARVVECFRAQGGRPLKAKDVGRALGLSADDRSAVRAALSSLVDEGVLHQLEGRRYVLAGQSNAHQGTVQRKATGSAWFIPEDKRVGDAFLPPHEIVGVIDGDRVLCSVERQPRGAAAKVLRVLERRRSTVTGVLMDSKRARYVEADDNVLSGPLIIPEGPEGNSDAASPGDVVEVLIVEPPTAVTTAVGRIVRSLGKRGRIDVEIERILAEKKVVKTFPPEVEDQAGGFPPDPTADDWAGRQDLRSMPLVTIDGETAKDFDDAVFALARGKDVMVTVAIADVSHYVRAGSPLDVEAARRGTSIYYPGKVVPMLPEALSNGLCSLKPKVDRLCLVAEFAVDPHGAIHKAKFYDAVMNSHARLTYTLAQKFYDGDAGDAPELTPAVRGNLLALQEASRRLRAARAARGALDFDLPETLIALDDHGEPVKIHPLDRLDAHRLIEDLMVAANEAVAQRFEEKGWPSVYRVHEAPDPEKLDRFVKLAQLVAGRRLRELEPTAKGGPSPKGLMAVLRELGEKPARRALDSLLLRSMMQAKYSPDNVGHYGLGSGAYLHFTSPIRRYPDLVVHRLLKERLAKGRKKKVDDEVLHALLDDIATTSSQCERVATDIERAVAQLHAAWFMKDRVGEVFDGVVQGVAEFGLFVQLEGAFVEGMVRVSDLGRDYYQFDEVRLRLVGERSGEVFTVGDRVRVRVAGVDLARRQIGLVLDEMKEPAARPPRGRGHARDGSESARSGEERAPGTGRRRDLARDERPGSGRRGTTVGRRTRSHEKRAPREERAGRRSAGEHSTGERSAGERSAGERSAGERSTGERSAGVRSAAERPARGRGPHPGHDDQKAPRPVIRGPEDLRRIFDEKRGPDGDGHHARGGSPDDRRHKRGGPKRR